MRHYTQEVLLLEAGKTYTFSAYANTSNISSSNNGGAFLAIYYINSAGSYEGSAANKYNLVENADFDYGAVGCELPDGWTEKHNFDENDALTTNEDSRFPQSINNKCFTMSGNATLGKDLGQSINVAGKKDDSFVLSEWSKGDSVLLSEKRGYALCIEFHNGNPVTAKIEDSSTFIQLSATYTPSGNYVSTMTDAFGNITTYSHDEEKVTLTHFDIHEELVYIKVGKGQSVADRLCKTMSNELMNIVTIFIGFTVGATATAITFLSLETIEIMLMGY